MAEQRSPQESNSSDPFEVWRQLYEKNEQAWTKAMKDVITTQGYAEAQGKMLEVFLSYQKMMRDATTSQLSNLNVPTRDDVSRLGELIVGLEEKLDSIADRLADLEEQLDERLTSLDRRFGRLQDRLGDMNGMLREAKQAQPEEAEAPQPISRTKRSTRAPQPRSRANGEGNANHARNAQ